MPSHLAKTHGPNADRPKANSPRSSSPKVDSPKAGRPKANSSRADSPKADSPKADNKVRLSPDVLEKAEHIATAWGLKNARAAVEAVFRKYCDDYLYGRPSPSPWSSRTVTEDSAVYGQTLYGQTVPAYGDMTAPASAPPPCDALDALDQLLAL